MVMLVAKVWYRFVNIARPFEAEAVTVPCKVPAPLARAAVTIVVLFELIKLPNGSSIRTTGCCAKATPAVALVEGWVWIVTRLAAAGLTVIVPEITLVRLPLVKAIVILVATACERLVKVTIPPTAVRLVAPCNTPTPALRAAKIMVVLSLLRRLPNWSSMRSTGGGAKIMPAVAVPGGCVWIVNRLAAAALTTTLLEADPVKLPLLKLRLIVSATV